MEVLHTEEELLKFLQRYSAIAHISGFGCKQQYANIDEVTNHVAEVLFEGPQSLNEKFGKGKWIGVFGGDPLDPAAPDIAALVHNLQTKHGMPLLAIQADKVEKEWGGVDKHIDAVYYYPTQYAADGKSVLWGGLSEGKPAGTTKVMLEENIKAGLPMHWISAGGGDITVDELSAAYEQGIPVMHIPARAKLPQDADYPQGPCPAFWKSMDDFDTLDDSEVTFRIKKINS